MFDVYITYIYIIFDVYITYICIYIYIYYITLYYIILYYIIYTCTYIMGIVRMHDYETSYLTQCNIKGRLSV